MLVCFGKFIATVLFSLSDFTAVAVGSFGLFGGDLLDFLRLVFRVFLCVGLLGDRLFFGRGFASFSPDWLLSRQGSSGVGSSVFDDFAFRLLVGLRLVLLLLLLRLE
jgi:hypothetical protein